jgi:hypothetical protein
VKRIAEFWRAESARIMSIVLAVAAAGLIPGVWGKLIGIVLPLLGGQAVRQTVFAPATVAEKVELAATSVAGQLSAATAGAAGQVLPEAQAVVDGVVAGVLEGG